MGGVDRAIRFGDAKLLGQLLRAQPAIVGFGQALGVEFVQIAAQAGFLLGVTRGAIQRAALAVVAVDAFAGQYLGHLVGDAVQQIKGSTALLSRQPGQQTVFAQQVAHQPATIAARCAEAGGLRLDDCDVQLRRLALEVIGRPQPGVTGADNGHVDIQVVRQGWPRHQRLAHLIHP